MADISRIPPNLSLELYAGDGVAIRFTVAYNDETIYPLDGIVTSDIKLKRTDAEPIVSWTVDDTEQDMGVVTISLSGEQTTSLIINGKAFSGVWDLQFKPTGAEAMTFLQGKVGCDLDVTR